MNPSPGSFKLTCGASGVDYVLFQPAPVAGLVLQSIQLCPATEASLWSTEGIPEPSCHGRAVHVAFFHTCIFWGAPRQSRVCRPFEGRACLAASLAKY